MFESECIQILTLMRKMCLKCESAQFTVNEKWPKGVDKPEILNPDIDQLCALFASGRPHGSGKTKLNNFPHVLECCQEATIVSLDGVGQTILSLYSGCIG